MQSSPALPPPPPEAVFGAQTAPSTAPELLHLKSWWGFVRLLSLLFALVLLVGGAAYLWVQYAAYTTCVNTGGASPPYCAPLGYWLAGPIYLAISGAVGVVIWTRLKPLEALSDAGRFTDSRQGVVLWMILGFVFGVVLGILLLMIHYQLDVVLRADPGPGPALTAPMAPPPPPPYPGSDPAPGEPAPTPAWAASPAPPAIFPPPSPYSTSSLPPVPAPPPASSSWPPSPIDPPPSAAPYTVPAPPTPTFSAYTPPPVSSSPRASTSPDGVPVCTGCGKPASFVPTYNRYYCYTCSKYA